MSRWFDRAFLTAGTIVAEARHELIDRGWFSRNFSPPASGQPAPDRSAASPERDIHGNERGIER